jgi:hypothetical protein
MLTSVISICLEGPAYVWFRSEIKDSPFLDWNDFKTRVRREFQGWGYEIDLRRNLDSRTQSPDEPLTVFIQVVRVPLTHFSISPREPPSSSHKLTIQPPNYPPLARSLISPLHYSLRPMYILILMY